MSEMMAKIMSIDKESSENHDDELHEQQDTEIIKSNKQKRFECELCGYKCDVKITSQHKASRNGNTVLSL